LNNSLSIKIYEAYVSTCETLIAENNLSKANEKNCRLALKNKNPNFKEVEEFFKNNFVFEENIQTNSKGIMTGYYEPEIKAYKYHKKNTYPIYTMDIEKYGENIFKSTRREINNGLLKNKGLELAWVENEIEAFFFHIQGSGRLHFPDGEVKRVRFLGSNNKQYSSIGKILLQKKKIKKENISMYSIKDWLYKNKKQAAEIMNQNERYIFFKEYKGEIKGSAGVDLQPMISVAVDTSYHNLGDILLINDIEAKRKFLAIAHDTGAAIKGKNRIDLFTGYGYEAEKLASGLNKEISINKLKPIDR
tara:strand:- start:349 stop:1260 length:912 start_codon:yes stop_codon:yes gene_type:complete